MKKQLPVVAEFEYECPLEPFVIAFVYPNIGEAFVAKGGYSDVKKYVKNCVNIGTVPACVVNYTYWRDKKAVEETRVYGLDPDVTANILKEKPHGTRRFHYTVVMGDKAGWVKDVLIDKWLRRRPRKWLKDLDAFLK